MLKDLTYELLRGLAYRKIRHGSMVTYTIWLPLFLWIIITAIYLLLPAKPILLGKDGALSAALSVIATLPGFYFAGLAAVATFGSPSMDEEMPSPAPEIDLRVRGHTTRTRLTRRLFLSYMFSYLVIISFLLCFLMLLLNFAEPSLRILNHWIEGIKIGADIWSAGKLFTVMILGALFSSMIITTLHGIFFLTEKIHQP